MSDVSLNAGIRSNLLSLQQSSKLFDRTTERLASGRKVNSAVDNPTNFFASVNLTDRSEGLTARLDGMGQTIQQIKAADSGITTMRGFISAMKGIVNNALGNTDSNSREALGRQFNELIVQLNTTAKDSGYQGVNLLRDNETSTVQFNETFDESVLDVKGFNVGGPGAENIGTVDATGNLESAGGFANSITIVNTAGETETTSAVAIAVSVQDSTDVFGIQSAQIGSTGVPGAVSWSNSDYKEQLAALTNQIENFDEVLKTQASNLAQNLATITIREEFTNQLVNTLSEGSDKLVLADLNEEGANLLALQTSNQLATQSLSLASQQSQQVLQLLG
jgi:flagellin-like hook-associated protein FlgL